MMSYLITAFLLLGIHTSFPRARHHQETLSPLMQAARTGNVAQVQLALTQGNDINACSSSGKTALHYALEAEQEAAAVYLINQGANINALDDYDNTPLSLARKHRLAQAEAAIEKKFLAGAHFGQNLNNNDKHFIFLIASYNNEQWYQKNLDSVFAQKHAKYTAIYIDDLSTDNTFSLVQSYIAHKQQQNRVILIKNKIKRFCLGNYLYAIERFCPNNAILITLDGDDWLRGANVLSYLNRLYQKPRLWLTYGESLLYPQRIKTPHCRPLAPEIFRKKRLLRLQCKRDIFWPVHHLRSFYTWLFRSINYQDLMDNDGKPFTYAEDVAYMLPMLEMAGPRHHQYVSKMLYVYNRKNPLATTYKIPTSAIHQKLIAICNKPAYSFIKFNQTTTNRKKKRP
jgi:glycosyltransferase involved in cell wall biosynthesis